MLVEEMMHKHVYKLKESNYIYHAIDLMEQKHIRHIPIVNDDNELIGIVSDRDIRSSVPSVFANISDEEKWGFLTKPLHLIMTKNVITVHPLDFVEEIAMLFYIHQIGSLPVVQDGQLVGMLTETDVLKTFVQLTGANQPGSQIEIRTKDTHGMLIEILKVIDQFQVNIQSVLLYPDKADPSKKIIVLRLNTINPNPIVDALIKAQFDVIWPRFKGMSQ